jgi:membrane protein implicated in regulation of membrane protease activity
MDGETITWIFLIGGFLLMLFELLVPTGFTLLLGVSGLLVGLLRLIGLFDDPLVAVGAWVTISVLLTIAIRPLIKNFFKGEESFKYADEDYEAMDQIVEAVEDIDEEGNGRIRFQGISWKARTLEGSIPAGEQVRIKYRDNVTWIVEPVDYLPDGENQKTLNPKNRNHV